MIYLAQNDADFLSNTKKSVEKLIKLYINELSRPERIEDSSTNHLASTLATLVDKFYKERQEDNGAVIITHQIPRAEEEENDP